jgi:putative hydrolase of the HAD superfamily
VTRSPARIRAVLFDLGGTLVDYHDYAHWTALAQRCLVDAEEEAIAHAFHQVERATDNRDRVGYVEFWRRVLSQAAEREVETAVAERFLGFVREQPGFFRLYSDTRRCLEALRSERRRLGVISNSSSEAHTRQILHATGILPYFERVVSSGTEGVEKPDPEIFHRTLRRMRLPAAETMYVGNLEYTDAFAAREAGLHSVWLNRAGTGMGLDPPEITSLLEVPLAVRQLEAAGPPETDRGGRLR